MRFLIAALVSLCSGCTLKFDPALLDEAQAGCACTDGVSCFPGTAPEACGKNGGTCQACAAPLSVCQNGACAVENAVVAMDLANAHTGAVDREGGLWMWGANHSGALALPETIPESSTPVRVPGDQEWTAVAVGGTLPAEFSCGIAVPGELFCWGNDGDGQTGTDGSQPGPQPTRVGSDSDWSAVGAGSAFACGIHGGKLYCWGYGSDSNRLGLASIPSDTKTPQLLPGSESWAQLSVGDGHSCAIRADQSLWCWGDSAEGQLGHAANDTPLQVEGGTSYILVSAGGAHTCGIRSNHTLWCWGDNTRGQLGISQSASTPVQVDDATNWISVAVGGNHTCGVRDDGSLRCWGGGDNGQLGLGTLDDSSVPTLVPESGPWSRVTAGQEYSCGVKEDGTLWCWGANGNGQLGIEAPSFQPAPSPTSVLLAE
jgi:alpha-tubulin suppressor-like RCC1 family protein